MNDSTLSSNYGQDAERFLKYFGWLIFVLIAASLIISHAPPLFHRHWTTCSAGGSYIECLWILYILGVTIIGFNAFFAWYYFKSYQRKNAHELNVLLLVTHTVNIVYLTFQTGLVLVSTRRGADFWETMTLLGLAVFLIVIVAFGIKTKMKLKRAIYNA